MVVSCVHTVSAGFDDVSCRMIALCVTNVVRPLSTTAQCRFTSRFNGKAGALRVTFFTRLRAPRDFAAHNHISARRLSLRNDKQPRSSSDKFATIRAQPPSCQRACQPTPGNKGASLHAEHFIVAPHYSNFYSSCISELLSVDPGVSYCLLAVAFTSEYSCCRRALTKTIDAGPSSVRNQTEKLSTLKLRSTR